MKFQSISPQTYLKRESCIRLCLANYSRKVCEQVLSNGVLVRFAFVCVIANIHALNFHIMNSNQLAQFSVLLRQPFQVDKRFSSLNETKLKMKGVFFLTICSLLANISFAGIFNYIGLNVGPECISLLQILRTTITLCEQRENRKMWDGVINCHRPMNDEVRKPFFFKFSFIGSEIQISNQFLRASAEAQCPRPKYVQQPNNTANSIEDVFLNICGVLEGGLINFGIVSLSSSK